MMGSHSEQMGTMLNLLTTMFTELKEWLHPTTRLAESQRPDTTYRRIENIYLYSQH
jgi:hypothetical protein